MSSPPIPDFLLSKDGSIPSSIVHVLKLPALRICHVDSWIGGIHRRTPNVTFKINGTSIRGNTTSSTLQKRFGAWVPAGQFRFDHFLNGNAYCIPTYTEKGLICFTATHRLSVTGQAVQFAIYPANYQLTSDSLQVLDWINEISPRIGVPSQE